MRDLISAVVVLLVVGFAIWRGRRRRVTNNPVSRRWLQDRRYPRDGDDRLWK